MFKLAIQRDLVSRLLATLAPVRTRNIIKTPFVLEAKLKLPVLDDCVVTADPPCPRGTMPLEVKYTLIPRLSPPLKDHMKLLEIANFKHC